MSTAANLSPYRTSSTQFVPDFVRTATAFLRDRDRRRAGFALGVTFRLAGLSGKRAADALERHESTVSRYADGEHDTPHSRVRDLYRKLTRGGAFPAPLLADLLADAWRENVQGKSLEELEEMKRALHRQEQAADARVDVWQMDDLCGRPAESEDDVDDAILSQIARLLELYTVRQEIRLHDRQD